MNTLIFLTAGFLFGLAAMYGHMRQRCKGKGERGEGAATYDGDRKYVAQKAILYTEEGELLVMRRTESASTRALHWDLPGGELDRGEEAEKGIILLLLRSRVLVRS